MGWFYRLYVRLGLWIYRRRHDGARPDVLLFCHGRVMCHWWEDGDFIYHTPEDIDDYLMRVSSYFLREMK